MAFAPSSLTLANYILPVNRALCGNQIMRIILITILTLQLFGCASFKELPAIGSDVSYKQRAEDIFETSSKCWNKETGFMSFGTVVAKYSFESHTIIEARYVSAGEESGMHNNQQEPFIKFIVRPTETGSSVTILEKTMPYAGKSAHVQAANMWADGIYKC